MRDLPHRLPLALRDRAAQGEPFVGTRTGGTQAEYARIPLADGTLVKTPGTPTREQIPSLLAASDVLGTGWFAADEAGAGPGATIVIVGDGAVGLGAIIGARQQGASRIIAMSRHADRQALAREFGATDIVEERGEEGIARIKEMTGGLGADGVVEAVGNEVAFNQALGCVRPGGHLSFVGVPHGVSLDMSRMFAAEVHMFGGPPPCASTCRP